MCKNKKSTEPGKKHTSNKSYFYRYRFSVENVILGKRFKVQLKYSRPKIILKINISKTAKGIRRSYGIGKYALGRVEDRKYTFMCVKRVKKGKLAFYFQC